MPHLPFSIELHDSDVTSIVLDNGAATVKLRPAYVETVKAGAKTPILSFGNQR